MTRLLLKCQKFGDSLQSFRASTPCLLVAPCLTNTISLYHPADQRGISLPTLLDFVLIQVSELVHGWCGASDNTLGELGEAANRCALPADGVLCGGGVDLDEADSWVLWATVVRTITEISDPGLQTGGVILADLLAVGLDGDPAGDGGPLAGGVVEGKVDVGVVLEVVGLARLGVGVEKKVDVVILLGSMCQ